MRRWELDAPADLAIVYMCMLESLMESYCFSHYGVEGQRWGESNSHCSFGGLSEDIAKTYTKKQKNYRMFRRRISIIYVKHVIKIGDAVVMRVYRAVSNPMFSKGIRARWGDTWAPLNTSGRGISMECRLSMCLSPSVGHIGRAPEPNLNWVRKLVQSNQLM